jgi:hypothetical protein
MESGWLAKAIASATQPIFVQGKTIQNNTDYTD